MNYFDQLSKAMETVAQHPRAVFMGQAVEYPGTAMFNTLKNVPKEKKLELPVAEDMQMGMAIGMSLNGELPICIYPRINFLLLAINQLVLHLDKLPLYSRWKPKVIIRTAIAIDKPMDPGHQHLGDFTLALRYMLSTVRIRKLINPGDIVRTYQQAIEDDASYLIVENMAYYGMT